MAKRTRVILLRPEIHAGGRAGVERAALDWARKNGFTAGDRVAESDATLYLTRGKRAGKSADGDKPLFVAIIGETPAEVPRLWLMKNLPKRLAIQGPVESRDPGIGRAAKTYLTKIFQGVRFVSALGQVPRPGRNGRRRLVGPTAASLS